MAALVMAATAMLTGATTAGAAPASSLDIGYICSGQPIPAGHVLLAYTSTGCNGAGAWTYGTPIATGTWVCGGSPVPPGYRIVQFSSSGCSGIGASLIVSP